MGNQASSIPEGYPLPSYYNINFNESNSNFTTPSPGHSILWEMGENGQKEGALIIIPFFN
jgi:hypothetical protein